MVGELSEMSRFRNALRPFTVALVLSVMMVWAIEQIIVARGVGSFQESVNRHAAHLADGNNKAVVLGSMIMMGSINQVIRDTAQGSLKPSNHQAIALLTRLEEAYALSNIRIINAAGEVVAYVTKLNESAIGKNRSSRPYFIAAMKGVPSMYGALGHTSGERGFYIAAPVLKKDAPINVISLGFEAKPTTEAPMSVANGIVGAVVAKLDFKEVDRLLSQESSPLAVVSPEGVIFATNRPAWQFRVLGTKQDLAAIRNDQRVSKAYEKGAPQLLEIDQNTLKMAQAPIDWKDPQGAWRLVGFAEPAKIFSNTERILAGVICFAFILMLQDWMQARQRVAKRTVELEEANLHLESLSNTDGLTKLSNRRHFDEVFAEEWMRARRNEQSLALMVIDVDYFKRFNDCYGHPAGDKCLENVANVLKSNTRRPGDLAARYGGEEFCLLLPDTSAANALQLAREVRRAIEILHMPHELSPLGMVTVSIGVAAMLPDSSQDAASLLHAADSALYRAKSEGRNRVVSADGDALNADALLGYSRRMEG